MTRASALSNEEPASRTEPMLQDDDKADPLARIPVPALRGAAQHVIAEWGEVDFDVPYEEAIGELVLVARAIAEEEMRPAVVPETTLQGVLRRRLLDLLRSALLAGPHGWQPPAEFTVTKPHLPEIPAPEIEVPEIPASELIELLRACEQVRVALEPHWDQRFASYLSAPTGFELLIEVAHDLRSPLTSILFLSEVLQKGHSGPVNEVQRRQLGIVYSAALGLISVASDLIEFARGGDQLLEPEPTPFSIRATLESVSDIVQPLAEEKGLAIRLFPPEVDHRLGFPVALNRVLLNLTTNALKFTDEGVVEIVARALDDSRVEFSVRDTGRGIDPEVIDSLFQPFRRSESTQGGYQFSGSGLGLVISRRLITAMGSELEFETAPSWGTRFYFELDLPRLDIGH